MPDDTALSRSEMCLQASQHKGKGLTRTWQEVVTWQHPLPGLSGHSASARGGLLPLLLNDSGVCICTAPSLSALYWHASSSPPEYGPKDGQSFVDLISFQYSAPLFLNKITSKTQTRLIHMWTLPKLSSKGANTCLMLLWTHCCPFTCIYFAWPVAEPWKLENKLLFSKSCQRWPLCQRVDCGTNTPLIRGLFCSAAVSTVTYLSAEAFSLSCLCWKP